MTLAQAQAQAQAQKIFLFSLACAYASFALLQVKTKYCSRITQAQGYLPHVVMFGQIKTLDPDYLAPKQFSKMAELRLG